MMEFCRRTGIQQHDFAAQAGRPRGTRRVDTTARGTNSPDRLARGRQGGGRAPSLCMFQHICVAIDAEVANNQQTDCLGTGAVYTRHARRDRESTRRLRGHAP